MGFAVWLTGLSGSGKSAIAKALLSELEKRSVDVSLLESDVMRTQLTPRATYDEPDRDFFYRALADIAVSLVEKGRGVIVDATANRRVYRDAVRRRVKRFCETYIDTPLEVCRARDTKGLYRAQKNLPGVSAPYEPPFAPEVVVHGDRGTPDEAAKTILAYLDGKGWIPKNV